MGRGAVLLPVCRLAQVDLLELEQVAGRVLDLALEVDLRGVLDDSLDVHLDKLVERVELLSDETLLLEIRRYPDPAGLCVVQGKRMLIISKSFNCKNDNLLPNLVGYLLALFPLVHKIILCFVHFSIIA